MSKSHDEDREIQELMRVVPMSQETPVELKSRLQTLAGMTRVRRPSVWPMRLAMAGVAAVAVIGIGITMLPTTAEAKSFAKVMKAADTIDRVELTMRDSENGATHNIVIAAKDNTFVMKADGMQMQLDTTGMKIYDPKKNELSEMKWPVGIDPKEIAKSQGSVGDALDDLDLKKKLAEYEQEYGKENIHVSPITHRFGKSTYEVTMQKQGDPERVHMTVDADTDLPTHIEVEKLLNGTLTQTMVMDLKFGNEVDLDPHFPANVKKVTIDFSNMKLDFKGFDFTDKKPNK
jgi:hypothetical protein